LFRHTSFEATIEELELLRLLSTLLHESTRVLKSQYRLIVGVADPAATPPPLWLMRVVFSMQSTKVRLSCGTVSTATFVKISSARNEVS